jgi:O-antigen ligase
MSRAEALDRLFATNMSDENRVAFVPTLLQMARDFFPFGSGFGSFDPVFRFYEPDAVLRPTYLNHAHNDLLELAITGGLPAMALLGLLIAWMVRGAWLVSRAAARSPEVRFAQFAIAGIVIVLLGSLLDYPLRTPLFALFFAIFSGWLAGMSHSSARHGKR